MVIKLEIVKSERNDKRFKAYFIDLQKGKVVKIKHFGSPSGKTYIDHADKNIRDAYIARHSGLKEDWNDLYSAGALSRWILWGRTPYLLDNVEWYTKQLNKYNDLL